MANTTVMERIVSFVESIGIAVQYGNVPQDQAFLPGLYIRGTTITIDRTRLLHPGDILHEAGHVAVAEPSRREQMEGVLTHKDGDAEELMAIAWSYAAALHLGIDPHLVFHDDGYKGGGYSIVENFAKGFYFGVSALQWIGLTYEKRCAQELNCEPYPKMVRWLRTL